MRGVLRSTRRPRLHRRPRPLHGPAAFAAVLLATAAVLAGCTSGQVTARPERLVSTPTGSSRFHEGLPYAVGRVLDVHEPTRHPRGTRHSTPAVVLLHGCCGDRSDLGKLSEAMAAEGLVVFNVDWAGLDADATFPDTYADVACALGFAQQHAADFGADPERVILAGWSDGAMAAAAVGGAPERFVGGGCSAPTRPRAPLAVVGIAGFFGWTVPVAAAYATPRATRLLGGAPDAAAESWTAATAYSWLSSAPPTLLLVGTTDPLVDDARRYAAALQRAGRTARVVALPPDGDQSLISPRTSEGRRVVAEVAALGRSATLDEAGQPADEQPARPAEAQSRQEAQSR